ncbi:MAG: type II toxin-antitoxin system HicB family antitoxin [Candidatus Methanospirareceae archaeon]
MRRNSRIKGCLRISTLQGLIAQGRTIAETMEIAQDVARKLIESYIEHGDPLPFEIEQPSKN